MRLQYLLHVAAGGMICAPAVLRDTQQASFSSSLVQTERSLEILEGIRADLEAGDIASIVELRGMTEPALPVDDPSVQEERLAALRAEVALLDAELAELELASREAATPGAQELASDPLPGSQSSASASVTTTGLDEAQRQALGNRMRPTVQQAAAQRRSHEDAGYVADDLRLGHALYRAGRFAESAAALAQLDTNPEATYWRARALEKLEQAEAALESYDLTKTLDPESEWALRAARDSEFLRWQTDLEQKLQRP